MMDAPGDAKHRTKMRTDGYADGIAGKPRATKDAEYLRSYRRGVEARDRLDETERR